MPFAAHSTCYEDELFDQGFEGTMNSGESVELLTDEVKQRVEEKLAARSLEESPMGHSN